MATAEQSPPFFPLTKRKFLLASAYGLTVLSASYAELRITRREVGEGLRDGKEELPFQLFREGSRGRRDPHDRHKDGEAEPGRPREIHRLCPLAAGEDTPVGHRQPSSMVRKPPGRGEIIEIRGA